MLQGIWRRTNTPISSRYSGERILQRRVPVLIQILGPGHKIAIQNLGGEQKSGR
jgi:hypothetical protein